MATSMSSLPSIGDMRANITDAFRLGKKPADGSESAEPRAIKIVTPSASDAAAVLGKTAALKREKSVIVVPDLTPQQRLQKKSLMPECDILHKMGKRPFWKGDELWMHEGNTTKPWHPPPPVADRPNNHTPAEQRRWGPRRPWRPWRWLRQPWRWSRQRQAP